MNSESGDSDMLDDSTCSASGTEASATSSDDTSLTERSSYRKKRRLSRYENYIKGTARGVYKLRSQDLEKAMDSSPTLEGICSICASGLAKIASGFAQLKHQGTELKKTSDREHYRDINAQNEWLRVNVSDSMGNYLFCHQCIRKALKVSSQRLTRQRNVKRKVFQQPLTEMLKKEVNDQKLSPFVLMPDGLDTAFNKWWSSIPDDHTVTVRYPHARHGLSGHSSNHAKRQAKQAFLEYVDANSQPNGRRIDSRNPTHYLSPCFKTISTPRRSVKNYQEKVKTSLVCEFNRIQLEQGMETISDFSATTWLKQERPKLAIYPHQVDYCDFCAKVKKEIQGHQQTINRLKQSGSAHAEDIQQAELAKSEAETLLSEHREIARDSLKYYRDMKDRCAKDWKEIQELQTSGGSSEHLRDLQHKFTLVLSADYQRSKLLPYWGNSPQPGSTYYFQKVSYDLLGVVDHRDEAGFIYLFSELIGPKNTDHTFSYLLHYLKSSGQVPGWIKRVQIFLDNAGSTNKNKYLMAAIYEVVQQKVFHFFRVSFMVAGHTKFAPDQLFSIVARAYYASNVFNEKQLVDVVSKHARVVIDTGKIVRSWREVVSAKYTSLPGIRDLHDFLALQDPSDQTVMKVKENCYNGTLRDIPMKITDESCTAIPTVNQSYHCLKRVKQLSDNKMKDLKNMCTNFIPSEQWHELLSTEV